MRRKWHLRKTSPGDTLRAINKYWEHMNVNWNNHRLMLHQSVIDRLDSGMVQLFKFKSRKDGSKRADWYEWEPFKHCFKKDTVNGKERIRFRTDTICPCIKIVNDKAARTATIHGVKNTLNRMALLKEPAKAGDDKGMYFQARFAAALFKTDEHENVC